MREGVLFPRWLPELSLGHGYPAFNFYAPSTYYLAEALHLSGLDYSQALMAAFGVLVIVAGFGMFLWARDLFGPGQDWAALVAATAYMYAPYVLTNVFIRGAIAEVGAQALLPWILWSTWRLMKAEQPANYLLPVVLSLGGLAVTHNVTLIFAPFFWLAYVLVLWWEGGRQPARLLWAGIGGLGALAVSAFFWAPMIVERQYLSGNAYKVAATYLPEHVWTWSNFLDRTFIFEYTGAPPFQLGLVQVVLAISGLMLARRRDPVWLFLVVVALVSGLGIAHWTLPLWFHSKMLLIAQFPWRLLTFMSLPLALFVGGILDRQASQRFACGLCSSDSGSHHRRESPAP